VMNEKEILMNCKGLPDYLRPNLDIVFIGLVPSLDSARSGNYFDGPGGSQFWKTLHKSGLVPDPLRPSDDHELVNLGIGLTNLVPKPGSTPPTILQLETGSRILREKLEQHLPKIAVFYGKAIFEVFSNTKNFNFGLQTERLAGTHQWVLPTPSNKGDSSALSMFTGLRKYRDFLQGRTPRPSNIELVFSNLTHRSPRKVLREEFILKKDDASSKRKALFKMNVNPLAVSPAKAESPLRKEEMPSTSRLTNNQQNLQENLQGVETSEDELEMPVLEAEVPFPTTPLSKAPSSPMSQGPRPGTQASPNPSRSMQLPLSQVPSSPLHPFVSPSRTQPSSPHPTTTPPRPA